MDVICVDDEMLALELLVLNCSKIEEIDSVQGFNSSAEALEYAKTHTFDVAFCDIDMPQMNGIELATAMRAINPTLNVVFTTAFSEYALDALNSDCSGYLLKPISKDKIEHQLSVLRFKKEQAISDVKKVRFQCLGVFQVFVNEAPPKFQYAKTLELLAILVDANGSLLNNRQLSCLLWEDDSDHTAYYKRLRSDLIATMEDLGCGNAFIISKGSLGIDKRMVECDYYDLLDGKSNVKYTGKYMSQYSWAEETYAFLEGHYNV